ncbi:hypothetical protein CCACVL1_15347 [Corchorus capsularis]|uniref:PGG domain-containing protein n=1 Tax=Corchorus capsularis TaxID=210143 RepID=A0A1R3I2T4_COCAP|nr:hypothetical protein CCACVL1_15347 [Corchorus capsularis]
MEIDEREIDIQRGINHFEQVGQPYEKALKDDAPALHNFYKYKPEDALFIPITATKDTVFHIAAYRGNESVLRVLLEMVPDSRKLDVLKLKNIHGNTILHDVATTDNVKAAELVIRKLLLPDGSKVIHEKDIRQREAILADRNDLGETPLFRAAAFGTKKMVMYFAKEIEEVGTLHAHLKRTDGTSILHAAVTFQKFETAIWLLEKDPTLATYKLDMDGKTCLHLLAGMPTAFKSTCRMNILKEFIYMCIPIHYDEDEDEFDMQISSFKNKDLENGQSNISHNAAWKAIEPIRAKKRIHKSAVKLMEMLVRKDASWLVPHEAEEDNIICLHREEEEMEEAIPSSAKKRCKRQPDTPLLIAAKSGIEEIVMEILKVYPQAVEHINQDGQNILHLAIKHRQFNIFNIVVDKEEIMEKLVLGIDNFGCTILHYAAVMECYSGGTSTTVALKLQEELKWFKIVQHKLPSYYTIHRNKQNIIAKELFNKEHKEQHQAAQEWVKNTSQSCSTVAILVATVVFSVAYTAPGGYIENVGKPILLEKPLYSFFTVMDVAGLASSLTSVVIFLSILTSSLEIDEFLRTLPRKLSLGFIFLFFSVSTTMLTFTSTIFLLIHLEKRWTASLTYAAAFLPIGVFALFQSSLYYEYTSAAIRSIYDFILTLLPGNWDLARFKRRSF